ncbi:MAG: c-type cytochrome [Thiobacillaceae bacterium]
MNKIVNLMLAGCSLYALPALAAPFDGGDPAKGKSLYDSQCASCHAAQYDGDDSKMFTRVDHRIKSASALAQQISACGAVQNINLFPEDEANIGAYLNQQYYKFK